MLHQNGNVRNAVQRVTYDNRTTHDPDAERDVHNVVRHHDGLFAGLLAGLCEQFKEIVGRTNDAIGRGQLCVNCATTVVAGDVKSVVVGNTVCVTSVTSQALLGW